ncbi:MAG: transglutaminase domain-containing protein [Candidatus Eisenbacteria bacterium]|nr:transglutaminase domain-containing protein [Candidatus Eisenbacteria bacterium]
MKFASICYLAGFLSAVCSPLSGAAAEPPPAGERWYALRLDGIRAGWVRESENSGDFEQESLFRVLRQGAEIRLWNRSRLRRTTTGVRLATWTSTAPAETLMLEVAFAADSLRLERREAGRTSRASLPTPPGLLDPFAVDQQYDIARTAPDARARFHTFWADLERVVEVEINYLGQDTLQTAGEQPRVASRFHVASPDAPESGSTEWRDQGGAVLRRVEDLLPLVADRCSREEALESGPTADILLQMKVPLHPALALRGTYETVRYAVSRLDGNPLNTLNVVAPARRAGGDASVLYIESRLASPGEEPLSPLPDSSALRSSPLIQSDDPEIVRVAQREAGAGPDWLRARRLSRFVARHVRTKDFAVGFASARATLDAAEGDCTEHAVLLAALTRASGIPSRVKAGLVALGGEMGYHLWTEIWDGGAWVGLDPTFDRAPVDGRYLGLGSSTLTAGSVNALAEGILPWMGRVEVRVVDATLAVE